MNIKDKIIYKPGDEPNVMKSDPIGYLSPEAEGGTCHGCGKLGPVLETDSSKGEYECISLCITCLHEIIKSLDSKNAGISCPPSLDPKRITLSLVGLDGNAFNLMACFKRQALNEGWTPEEITEVLDKAKEKDYSHLLQVLGNHCKDPSSSS